MWGLSIRALQTYINDSAEVDSNLVCSSETFNFVLGKRDVDPSGLATVRPELPGSGGRLLLQDQFAGSRIFRGYQADDIEAGG